jgi:putative aldouronate transport system permease protein
MNERSIAQEPSRFKAFWQTAKKQKSLFAMSIPFALIVFVFSYLPLWGWIYAFQKYRPGRNIFEQQWVGLENFAKLFTDDRFYLALKNTLGMSLLGFAVGFTMPIIFAVLINELRVKWFKKTIQTVSYLPHFVSWVVVSGIIYKMLSIDSGPVNQILSFFGQDPVQFLAKPDYFWWIVVFSDLWKELGWNTIIFLAAITAIDPALYEAAKVDGAGRWRQVWHVTLPGISNIIIIIFILAIGNLISIGYEKQFLLSNTVVYDSAMVLDLFSLKFGIGKNNFSFGTAINIVNSVVSLILLFSVNGVFKRKTGQSVM